MLSHTGTGKESTAYVCLKFGVVSLLEGEDSGQKLEEHPPERRGLYGVDAAVEVRFADHLLHVAVLVEEQAGLVDVAPEEGGGHQGDGHHFGGCEPDLGIVAAVDSLEEVVTQAVDGGYGIVQAVLLIQERLSDLRIGRILSASIRGQLGLIRSVPATGRRIPTRIGVKAPPIPLIP
jgi:hypothetical protein